MHSLFGMHEHFERTGTFGYAGTEHIIYPARAMSNRVAVRRTRIGLACVAGMQANSSSAQSDTSERKRVVHE
jgi:hypothetical protein